MLFTQMIQLLHINTNMGGLFKPRCTVLLKKKLPNVSSLVSFHAALQKPRDLP